MRAFEIVTIKDEKNTFTYDVEVPTDVPAGKLADDIAEVLNHYKKQVILPEKGCRLKNRRTGKRLDPAETFEKAGVWQGDILIAGPNV